MKGSLHATDPFALSANALFLERLENKPKGSRSLEIEAVQDLADANEEVEKLRQRSLAVSRDLQLFAAKSVLSDDASFTEMRRVQVTTQRLKDRDAEAKRVHEEAVQWRTALVEQLQRKISGSIDKLMCTPGTAAMAVGDATACL